MLMVYVMSCALEAQIGELWVKEVRFFGRVWYVSGCLVDFIRVCEV